MARSSDQDAKKAKKSLSHELLHGLTPAEFNAEATALADMEALTPSMRERLKAQLVERLKTPVDAPSWGPDWVRRGERVAAKNQNRPGFWTRLRTKRGEPEPEPPVREAALAKGEAEDAAIIARNMEKSRQVAHYKPLYVAAAALALAIVLVSMFVDYHIIREIWTRALANEFMVVPDALKSSVVFKSLQVIFAVLIVHFMLKITGTYGRNTMITASFVMALFMIAGLGYLVAYNNMAGGTATAREAHQTSQPGSNPIDQLFSPNNNGEVQQASMLSAPRSENVKAEEGFSLGLPKLSETSLAHADSWFWLAFASVIFFIVTTVAALYMQTFENNLRNVHVAKDYQQRRKDFALLHLLELAEERG